MNCYDAETLDNFILNPMQYINNLAKKGDKVSIATTSYTFLPFWVHHKDLSCVLSSF